MLDKLSRFFSGEKEKLHIRIPRQAEDKGMLLVGDSGTGKTQLLHQVVFQARLRQPAEAGIVYDPACQLLRAHFKRQTDLVLNPLDDRMPFWSPVNELKSEIDAQFVASSFFPIHDRMADNTRFFMRAARAIFTAMLLRTPKLPTLIKWLGDEKQIDASVAGTEIAHSISKSAGPQRTAVLSTLGETGEWLRLLPSRESCRGSLNLSEWAQARSGWIFVTGTLKTRKLLRPLQNIFLDLLMKQLLSVDEQWGASNPCWLIADELHALQYLPELPTFIAEGRKYGIKYVFGTQSKYQLDHYYGETEARTMISNSRTKVFMRSNEPNSARWIAETIGDEERERPRVGTTAAVEGGRDSVNYSTTVENRVVVSKEQIMGLSDLQGYFKHGNQVVSFELIPFNWKENAESFIERQLKTIQETAQTSISPTTHNAARDAVAEVADNASTANDVPQKAPQTAAQAVAAGSAAEEIPNSDAEKTTTAKNDSVKADADFDEYNLYPNF